MNEQLDPNVVNLAKAIRQTESKGDFNAQGASGEWGAYQYTKGTWDEDNRAFGLNYEYGKATPEQQNEIAYKKLKKLKEQGYNPGQIASIWNSGKPNWEGNVGVNKHGVRYDTPAYVDSVYKTYQQYKAGNQNAQPIPNASTVGNEQLGTPDQPQEQKDGFLKSVAKGLIKPVATMVARPVQLGAELLGASAEQVNEATKKVAGDFVAPVPENTKDVLKDVGRGAETVALGLPVGSIGAATKVGALAGAGAGLEQSGDLSGTLKGAATGTAAGFAGGVLGKALGSLPKWLSPRNALGLSDDAAEQMIRTKSIGTKTSLLKQSQKAVSEYGKQIDDILLNTADNGGGNFALRATKTQFPEKTDAEILRRIKSFIPSGEDLGLSGNGWDRASIVSYVDKIANGTATLFEKNRVKAVLNHATQGGYAKLARAINPSAGQDIAMTFANNLATEIKNVAPSTVPIFEDFAREMQLRGALNRLVNKSAGSFIGYNDIIPYLAGESMGGGGTIKGLLTAGAFKAARAPATRFALAKSADVVKKVAKPVVSRAGLLPLGSRK